MEMKTPPKDNSNPEICQIRIMFPVDTDEQAIEYKRKIAEVLADKPEAQIHFSISPLPVLPARG